ncbi:hypothetical protein ScPMuIL_000836 [Solemya velum]
MKTDASDLQRVPKITIDDHDHYMESIELSNACRRFYHTRVKATEDFKQKLENSQHTKKNINRSSSSTMDVAMNKLKREMAGLMEQDLTLMEHLLTLNESIEDIKHQRLYSVSKDSIGGSSVDFNNSDWSVSETDMFDLEEDGMKKQTEYLDPDVISISNISYKSGDEQFFSCSEDIPDSLTEQFIPKCQLNTESCSKAFYTKQVSIESGIADMKECY